MPRKKNKPVVLGENIKPITRATELMRLLGISKTKFYDTKAEGVFDNCYVKRGRTVRYSTDAAIKAFMKTQ